jgi:hypothetical protein
MYAWPVLFPPLTNREDLLVTVSLFDDDTGAPLDLVRRTLAAPGDFTAAVWTVTSGAIVTASVTPLTIKDYPVGLEMQALALTVGVGLAILAGSPVTIADTATGLNTMTGYVTSYAPATGKMVAQIGVAFQFEIRGSQRDDDFGAYGSSSQIGTDCFEQPIIAAQLGSGITVIDLGVLQIRIPESTIAKLRHKTYGAAMAMYDGADTRQVFIGKLPVQSGGVASMPFPVLSPSNPYGLP